MNSEEYDNLNRIEREHWYYSGKRVIALHWLEKLGMKRDKSQMLVDCGAGTGIFAQEMLDHCRVSAVDDYEESLQILHTRLPSESVVKGSCTNLPFDDESVDFITALDVLEHIENDSAALLEMWRILKPGGGMVITVPALMCLWSDWDVSLHHFRRYDRAGLLTLVRPVNPEVVDCNYMNFFAFPAVWAMRKLRGTQTCDKGTTERAEDRVPPAAVNTPLRHAFVWSSCQSLLKWPLGVGLLCVLKKTAK